MHAINLVISIKYPIASEELHPQTPWFKDLLLYSDSFLEFNLPIFVLSKLLSYLKVGSHLL